MDVLSRREFLNRAAILSAAAAGGTATAVTRADGPPTAGGDKLRVAVVGVRSRGLSHVGGFLNNRHCVITTVCDCDEAVIGKAMTAVGKAQKQPPKYVKDFRRLLDDKEVDVISIATPNHWHALMAVWAMRAGKDVYVEKPCSHNVREGAVMVAAARKYNRVCQVGTQSRSNPGMRAAIGAVRGGAIGKVDLAVGVCYRDRPSIGKVAADQEPPATMDFDLWCGPGPLKRPRRKTGNGTVHYDWHWTWDYGNGDLGNQGVHEMDKARWGLGQPGLPRSVVSVGGRWGYADDGETANTQLSVFEYPGATLVFDVKGLKTPGYKGAGVGNIFVGTEGMIVCPNYHGGIRYDPAGKEVERYGWDEKARKFVGSDQHHYDNFVSAVRSRDVGGLTSDVAEGHPSAALCHLANISYRLGAEAPLDAAAFDNPAAAELLALTKAHLKGHGVDPAAAVGRVGPKLLIDPKAERFAKSQKLAAAADALLTREYRKGYELPEA